MYQFFVDSSQITGNEIRITGNDVNHIKNVLRMKTGDELSVSNGVDQREYRCGILSMEDHEIICELRFVKEDGLELASHIYLFQGLPKADKMELIIQKAVELGIYEIVPVSTARAVVKLEPKKEQSKIARWQGISEAAAKQSKRRIIPKIASVVSFKEAVRQAGEMDIAFIPYELAEDMNYTKSLVESIKPGQSVAIMIGPEGGFEEKEINLAKEAGIKPITLGRRILRTETAGFTILSWIMYHLEN